VPPPYSEILLPQTYIPSPGGNDFAISFPGAYYYFGYDYANERPADAVYGQRHNDSFPHYGEDWFGFYAYYAKNHGSGQFEMDNPTKNGTISNVTVRMLTKRVHTPDLWIRLWTHGTVYSSAKNPGIIGYSEYPPEEPWEVHEFSHNVNPFTLAAWTMAELNDLQAGFSLYAGPGHGIYTDNTFVLVTYASIEPVVTTLPASDIQPAQATLNGHLTDDGGAVCTLFFEWGATPALGNVAAAGVGTTGTNFSATIMGLIPGETYFFRTGATNPNGTTYGYIMSFSSASLPFGGGVYTSRVLMELL